MKCLFEWLLIYVEEIRFPSLFFQSFHRILNSSDKRFNVILVFIIIFHYNFNDIKLNSCWLFFFVNIYYTLSCLLLLVFSTTTADVNEFLMQKKLSLEVEPPNKTIVNWISTIIKSEIKIYKVIFVDAFFFFFSSKNGKVYQSITKNFLFVTITITY